MKYIVISPVRDEERHIERAIASVASQTVLPLLWIVVNDGSKDDTGKILDAHAATHPWMRVIHRKDRGFRQPGTGVMHAFYDGYDAIGGLEWDFLIKLDGDLEFEADYFERCFAKFRENGKLGIGGGIVRSRVGGRIVKEENPAFHVRGATKIYKRECWEAIAPLIRAPGWDTLDEVKASMKGFETRTFDDIVIIQARSTGTAEGRYKDLYKNGMANYISGYHPVFMLAKSARRVVQKPYLLGSMVLLWGYLSGYLRRVEQVDDRALIRYIREQQVNRMLFRKSLWG